MVKTIGEYLKSFFGALLLVVMVPLQIIPTFLGYVVVLVLPFLFVWQLFVAGWLPHALILGIIWYVAYRKWGRE